MLSRFLLCGCKVLTKQYHNKLKKPKTIPKIYWISIELLYLQWEKRSAVRSQEAEIAFSILLILSKLWLHSWDTWIPSVAILNGIFYAYFYSPLVWKYRPRRPAFSFHLYVRDVCERACFPSYLLAFSREVIWTKTCKLGVIQSCLLDSFQAYIKDY